jgi:DNA primase
MTVEELLNKKKIAFKPSGNDYLICCLNPEHDDSNPSLRVDKVLGIMNCLSCGFRGNLFYFYGEKVDKLSTTREKIKRKINDIRSESIGLKLPVDSEPLHSDFRVMLKTLEKFEAFRSSNAEYKGRVVFPIRDLKWKITAFIGRSEDPFDTPKYKIYPPNAKTPLYPIHLCKPEAGRIFLVEGIFDLLNLWDNGYRNVLCAFGTRKITKDKLQLLKIIGVTGIDICFDPDDPGQEAAQEVKELAQELHFHVRNINLRDCDPGDLTPLRATKLKEKLYG